MYETWLYHYHRRQSNNQWSSSIVAHHTTKNCECENPLEKFSPRFFGIKTASSSLIIYQRVKLRGVLLISAGANEGHFEGKTPREGHQASWSCSCTTIPRLTGHLQHRENWPTCASNVLITHPILWTLSRRTTTCSLNWKKDWKVAIFCPKRSSFLPQRFGWTEKLLIFLSGFEMLEQRTKKCIELHREYIE